MLLGAMSRDERENFGFGTRTSCPHYLPHVNIPEGTKSAGMLLLLRVTR